MQTLTIYDYRRMVDNAHMSEETRVSYRGYEIFIADGLSPAPHITFQKFGVEEDKYPDGAYGTLWVIAYTEARVKSGGLLTEDVGVDPFKDARSKKADRIAAAIESAKKVIDGYWRAVLDGASIHA